MKILRGNYEAKDVKIPEKDTSNAKRFEDEALKRLGGSIAFVAKKKVIWVKPKA